MASTSTLLMKTIFLVLIFASFAISPATSTVPEDCGSESANPRNVPFLQPDGNIFTIVKCFASGIILGTGFMHVLPDSFEMLSSPCLEENR
ncbi:unnamed protein product [Brassica oleracea]